MVHNEAVGITWITDLANYSKGAYQSKYIQVEKEN
jgi:hypothetical protein